MNLAAARPPDLPAIRGLLVASGLPGEDLTPAHLGTFWIVVDAAGLAGVVGIEPRGRAGLLRSLAVRGDTRGQGLGGRLLAHAESQADGLGIEALYLLTTTAEPFFAARGYAVTPRDAAPPEIRATTECAGLCPSGSVCMTKRVAS